MTEVAPKAKCCMAHVIICCTPPAGTGTVVNKTGIKQYQQATRDRSKSKTEGGKIIRVEAHPIPEHPRPRRVKGRVALVGDAAGYVTKCSGEGIYFAAKSGRMCAEAIVEASESGQRVHFSRAEDEGGGGSIQNKHWWEIASDQFVLHASLSLSLSPLAELARTPCRP